LENGKEDQPKRVTTNTALDLRHTGGRADE